MPTTRTQQKLLDKEIDFSRKDEHNNKVTIIKRWGKPDRYLDQYHEWVSQGGGDEWFCL